MAGISPKLPLIVTHTDGTYGLTKSVEEALIQDLKMIILTNPGEKIMDPSFGVGLKRFLFEQNGSQAYSAITSRIMSQTKKYLPQIEKILFNEPSPESPDVSEMIDSNVVSVTIRFSIRPLKKIQILSIPLL